MGIRCTAVVLFLTTMAAAAAAGVDQEKVKAGAEKAPSLHYVVSINDPAAQQAQVSVAICGLDPERTVLRLGIHQGQSFLKLPEPLLRGPVQARINGSPATIERQGPFAWKLACGGAKRIDLDYTVPLTHREIEEVARSRDQYEFPYLDEEHGMLTSWSLVIVPRDFEPASIALRFDLPESWDVIAPWQESSPGVFAPPDLRTLQNDLIAVGKWTTRKNRIRGFEATVAIAPGQPLLEKKALDPIRRIVESELDLFGRPVEAKYLFLFGRPDTPGAGGSPKNASMTLTVQPALLRLPEAFDFVPHLVAHEFFHTWGASIYDAPDELRWFNEGFTDYYAYLVITRLGMKSWEAFAEKLGSAMKECEKNPHFKKLSLAEAGGDIFFSDRAAYRMVYSGGMIVAAWLDRAIRTQAREGESSATLDDFMRAFNNDPRWIKGKRSPGLNDFLEVLGRFVDEKTVRLAKKAVSGPYALDPEIAFPGNGVTVKRFTVAGPKSAPMRFEVEVEPWKEHALSK